jgi:hypothetical protein
MASMADPQALPSPEGLVRRILGGWSSVLRDRNRGNYRGEMQAFRSAKDLGKGAAERGELRGGKKTIAETGH